MGLVSARVPSELKDKNNFIKLVYNRLKNRGLSDSASKILTAHACFASSFGKKSPNYMIAGIKAGAKEVCYGTANPTYGGDYMCLCTFEYKKGGEPAEGCSNCEPLYGVPRCKHPFRSYKTINESVDDFLKILQGNRYKTAYQMALNGSTEYFVEVGRCGWYTAIENSAAAKSMIKKMNDALNEVSTVIGGGLPSSINIPTVAMLTGSAILVYYTFLGK